MSPFHWPWFHHNRRDDEQYEDTSSSDADKRMVISDLNQIERINEFLLNKALSRGWINQETAEALRTEPTYKEDPTDRGSHPKPPS